jgi:transposase
MMNERSDLLKLEVIKIRRDGRRRFDEASKRRLIEACLEPGASISDMAVRYEL